MSEDEEFERELIVFPASRQEAPRVVTTNRFVASAKDIVRTAQDGLYVELENIRFQETAYTGERDPWSYPQFEDGSGGDESPTAYGRKNRENWRDAHYVFVHERGRLNGMPVNEYFAAFSIGGQQLVGPVIMHRFLHEGGCGDNCSLPVNTAVLTQHNLPDPRV